MDQENSIERAGLVAAVEQASNGIVITDATGQIHYVNPGFTAMTGYASGEAVGQHTRILKSGRQSPEFYKELWGAISSGRVWQGEMVNRRKDGNLYTEEMRITPILDSRGEIVHYLAIKQDVTERRAAEETKRFLASIVEHSEDAIVAITLAGMILTWNRGAETLFGRAAEEVVGRHISMLIAPARQPDFADVTDRVLHGATVSQFESLCLYRDGRSIYVSVSGSPILNSGGAVVAMSAILRDISERREAEQAQALLASIIEFSDDAIAGAKPDGTIVSWNRGAEVLFGYSSQEIVGQNVAMLAPPGRRDEVSISFGSIQKGGAGNHFESILQGKDGREIAVSLTISPIRNLAGEVAGASVIAHNITKRVAAERKLRESEERFRVMADGCPAPMWVTGADGGTQFINRALREFRGTTYEEGEGGKQQFSVSPDDAPDYAGAFQKAVREHTPFQGEARVLRSDGAWRWVSSYAEPRFSLDGGFLGHVGLSWDITENKQAEQARQFQHSLIRAIHEASLDGILVVNENQRIVSHNKKFLDVWRISLSISDDLSDDAWGEDSSVLSAALDLVKDPAAFLKRVQELYLDPGANDQCEIELKDGRTLERYSTSLRNHTGRYLGRVWFFRDITARKQVEITLREAREAADAANRSKSVFLTTMSHELRTPLNAILGFSELLELEMADQKIHTWDGDIQQIREAGNHLLALISDILDLSKIEAGKMELQPTSFDIAAVIREVAANMAPLAATNQVEVQVSCEPAIIHGDETRIRQCLFNLAGNACKFTQHGRVLLEAMQESRPDGAWYTVRVADTGIGISPEDLHKLFCDFTQVDASSTRTYGGSGLGLAISRRLSRLMGGDITAESTLGKGSTFTLRFPIGATPELRSTNHTMKGSLDPV